MFAEGYGLTQSSACGLPEQ